MRMCRYINMYFDSDATTNNYLQEYANFVLREIHYCLAA